MIRKRRRLNESLDGVSISEIRRIADGQFAEYYKKVLTRKFQESLKESPAYLIQEAIRNIDDLAKEADFDIQFNNISAGKNDWQIELTCNLQSIPTKYFEELDISSDDLGRYLLNSSGDKLSESEKRTLMKKLAAGLSDAIEGTYQSDIDPIFTFSVYPDITTKNWIYNDKYNPSFEFPILLEFH